MRILLTLLILFPLLASCASVPEGEANYPNRSAEKRERYGKISGEGGISLLGGKSKSADDGSAGIGVNGFLWRAALDTVNFMPIASADPFGGLILTDWYSPPENANERLKLNVTILTKTLRADGVKVAVFRQTQDRRGEWRDAEVAEGTARKLEDAILTKARQLRVAQMGEGE